MGLKAATPKSPRMISTAKREPAMGALKAAAIPLAAPQATRVETCFSVSLKSCPTLEPTLAPI